MSQDISQDIIIEDIIEDITESINGISLLDNGSNLPIETIITKQTELPSNEIVNYSNVLEPIEARKLLYSKNVYIVIFNVNYRNNSEIIKSSVIEAVCEFKQTAYIYAFRKEFSHNIDMLMKNKKRVSLDTLSEYGELVNKALRIDYEDQKIIDEFIVNWEEKRENVLKCAECVSGGENISGSIYRLNILHMSLNDNNTISSESGSVESVVEEKVVEEIKEVVIENSVIIPENHVIIPEIIPEKLKEIIPEIIPEKLKEIIPEKPKEIIHEKPKKSKLRVKKS